MPESHDLERLADDVRATAPEPDERFVRELEARVERGFPRPARARRRGWWLGQHAAAVAASAAVALVVGVAVLAGGPANDAQVVGDGGMAARSGDAAQESAAGDASTVAPAPRSTPVGPGARRTVERSAQLELAASEDRFGEVTAGVLRIADTTGTIVQRSVVEERGGRGFATYELRVPASRLDEALAALSRLADVRARSASSEDITGEHVAARDRLADARAERAALLRALERADDEAERDAIRARLREARRRIAAAEAAVRRVRARADRVRVEVTVRSTGEAGAWTPGDALDDAVRVLEVLAGVALVALAVLCPLGVLAALLLAARHATVRRRREAALG